MVVKLLPVNKDEKNPGEVVVVTYEQLTGNEDISDSIEKAFGFDGLGLIAVSGVQGLAERRSKLLPLAKKFADLPDNIKEKTVHAPSFYSVGWSHGKEMMSEGKPDTAKGSYYANPIHDKPVGDDEELIKKYPAFCQPNIWPKDDLPELESAFKDLGGLVVSVGELLAVHCDKYIHKRNPEYPASKLSDIIRNSRCHKARLLHYFPVAEDNEDSANWCGWHNDHGSLTGLVPAMYIDNNGKTVAPPSSEAGLYVRARDGKLVHVVTPPDCLAFQVGECSQIHSGGILQATPHSVRGVSGPVGATVSRETLAVFMEPEWHVSVAIPKGSREEDVTKGSSSTYLPKGVPLLRNRWKQEQTFGEFADATFKSYY